ncbi:transporter substrate-binding domain-containing diguanylate cyclase [Roseateles oligotrophus]|uniref:Transporter substrate-binding domain-containing protein n=1 Tax=Roseateles oligotrophus TaxID=1769250 RepID=A0ABT2YIT9_9BURK|nr:transporter substrate-binding domain-containing protein [Roseateles oligotrophus]MCV2369960.1 transporter substrate-binding domain-containing protein [Roseateles oligotrophus]
MRLKAALLMCLALALCMFGSARALPRENGSIPFDADQLAWIAAHKNQVLSVGFDPFAGVDSFEFQGRRIGLLPALLSDMQVQLGLRLEAAEVKSWDDAYSRFLAGKIDLLYGANPTPEREKVMRFTRAAQKYPYVVFARKDSLVQTLGDLDGKKVGFLANDFVIEQLPAEFPNIHIRVNSFEDQREGLKALVAGEVDGFVTAGGGVEYEFLIDFPTLTLVAEIKAITSDMTFAVARDRAVLGQIIDRYLEHRRLIIQTLSLDARRSYNRKVLRLSEAELGWLAQHGEAVVGVAEDYLPFDYFHNGEYKGIAGATLDRIGDLIGIRFKVVGGSFAKMLERAQAGEVHVLNLAKTADRQEYFLFPRAISTERDIIVGLKSSPPVQDVYGLDGRRVAVIDGFWHEEYLRKNLKAPHIVKTSDIMASLRLLRAGKVDYLIENPTVVEFYINGLGYTDLVKRGSTSKDSFVYFGVSRQQPELAAIMDKVIPLIQFDEMKYLGIQTVPTLRNEANRQLTMMLAALAVAMLFILALTLRTVRKLAEQKAKTQFLHEREHLLYTDSLTGFHNRNYFSQKADATVNVNFPQAIVVADMNNLKRVNDSHGHAAGDSLIKAFAAAALAQWPRADCYRIGGDEFVFILPDCAEQHVAGELEALRRRCQLTRFEVAPGVWISPSAALGHALRADADSSLQACIARADERMYAAKASMKKRRTDAPSEPD